MSFWQLTGADVERLRGGDGGRFRDFVVSLIRAHAFCIGIPASAIHTDSRPMKDGGVDCEVSEGSLEDREGRLRRRTIWQFKGLAKGELREQKLRQELRKPYVVGRLKDGYAYRLCVADDLTAQNEASRWLEWLSDEAREQAGREVDVQVLGSTALSAWANHYPPVVLRSELRSASGFCHIETWRKSITEPTPRYVENPNWEGIVERLRTHCDFSKAPPRVIELVVGAAGVGKTRLTFETVSELENASGLVLYTLDERRALDIACDLANDSTLKAILVVDDCSLVYQNKLEQILSGCKSTVRVIAIDNQGRLIGGREAAPQFLERLPDDIVAQVLEVNFPEIPDSNRRAAVGLSRGFLRIAIVCCQHPMGPGFGPAHRQLSNLYRERLSEEQQKVVEAISLVTRVGWRDEVDHEFRELCGLCGLEAEASRDLARSIKDVPGFIGLGGRYFYVTPEAIADVALGQAWARWIEPNPQEFLAKLPASLEEGFYNRIARCSNQTIRDMIAAHSAKWAASLGPGDLVDKKKADRLVRLAETQPGSYLPVLRRLVETASAEILTEISGVSTEGWGPRRSLVWLCQRLVAFPEFFYDAEAILFRLALHENEPQIANNASGVWKQLFQPFLSGTAVPYLERLQLLRGRFDSSGSAARLALTGLAEIFEDSFHRTLGPPIVAGRIPPEDWQPRNGEEKQCFESALELLEQVLSKGCSEIQDEALDLMSIQLIFLLRHGLLNWAKRLLDGRITEQLLTPVLDQVDLFLRMERKRDTANPPSGSYTHQVQLWRDSLIPSGFHARLHAEVGKAPYHCLDEQEEKEWRSRLRELAVELVGTPESFQRELPWLFSSEARGSGVFGEELGHTDVESALIDPVLGSASDKADSLAVGYVYGLLAIHPQHRATVNEYLDKLERTQPQAAFRAALTSPNATAAFDRGLRLFDSGVLPIEVLASVQYRLQPQGLSQAQLESLLQRVMRALERGDSRASEVGLSLCTTWLHNQARAGQKVFLNQSLLGFFPRLLKLETAEHPSAEYQWAELLNAYGQVRPKDAIEIACTKSDKLSFAYHTLAFLHEQAKQRPSQVMEALGRALLDDTNGWGLRIRGVGGLLSALPVRVVLDWLRQNGLPAARAIASSLPQPYLAENATAHVPELTRCVLELFPEDAETTRNFVFGSGGKTYSGDIAGQLEKEAKVVSAFLNHNLAAIREWARFQKACAEEQASRYRQEDAERLVPA